MKNWITNRNQLDTTPERKLVLDVAEAGLSAIDTSSVMHQSINVAENILTIQDTVFDLTRFRRVLVLGFGKASCKAAEALENILGEKITDGVVISIKTADLKHIRTFAGTHPNPSQQNVEVAGKMKELIADISENDLVICLVSGGGSALLCWDEKELEQNTEAYQRTLGSGMDITVLDTLRKHISPVKGGGLAKLLYPATVVSLIFSDIAGDNSHMVASGPTFLDSSTLSDAQAIVDKHNLGPFELLETPKEAHYFEKVHNITLVSNVTALSAMKEYAESLGTPATIVSAELLESPEKTFKTVFDAAKPGQLMLAGSEINLIIKKQVGGRGGRNTYLTTYSLNYITDADTFAAVASDGLDNSDCAGAIVDFSTVKQVKDKSYDVADYLDRYDGYGLFEKIGHEIIYTGPTGANVSDYLILYRK